MDWEIRTAIGDDLSRLLWQLFLLARREDILANFCHLQIKNEHKYIYAIC